MLGPDEWPKTLDEAVERLLTVLDEESKERLRATSEDDLYQYHRPWGMGIRNDFGLWRGNRDLLASCGRPSAHDASMLIIWTVWQRLGGVTSGGTMYRNLTTPWRPHELSLGQRVRIRDGALAGMAGEVRRLDEERGLVTVEITLLGRRAPVPLEFWQVVADDGS